MAYYQSDGVSSHITPSSIIIHKSAVDLLTWIGRLLVKDLKVELDKRRVSKSGNKAALVQKLHDCVKCPMVNSRPSPTPQQQMAGAPFCGILHLHVPHEFVYRNNPPFPGRNHLQLWEYHM